MVSGNVERFASANVLFGTLQCVFWAGFGLFFDFLVAFMESAEYTGAEIGIVMTSVSLFALVGQPSWGYITDSSRDTRSPLAMSLSTGVISVLILLLFGGRSFSIVLIFSTLASFCIQPIAPVIDSWIMRAKSSGRRVNYGITRAMGSLGFAVSVALGGSLMESLGMSIMFIGTLGLLTAALVVGLQIKVDVEGTGADTTTAQRRPQSTNPLVLLKDFEITVFLVLTILIFTSFRTGHIYLPLLITELGGTSRHLGMSLSLMAFSEVPMIAVSGLLLKRFTDVTLLMWSFILFAVRVALHLIVRDPLSVVLIQSFQGVSFALFLPAAVHFMHRMAPPQLRTTGQGLVAASSFGIGSVLGSAIGGLIIEVSDIYALYVFATMLASLTALSYYVLIYRRELRAGSISYGV